MSRIAGNFSFFSRPPRPPAMGSRSDHRLVRIAKSAGLFAFSAALLLQAGKLFQEWLMLREAVHGSRQSAVAGYLNISPVASFIKGPKDWYRDDGEKALLWFGYDKNVTHWFSFTHGEVDPRRLARPTGEYIVQAIDFPLVETRGGEIWKRVPPESVVVGYTIENRNCVYPVAILGKVQVINDVVDLHPYLVVINPFAPPVVAVSIFDSSLDGHRVTLAPTGYFQDGRPVLFDRGTESLWVDQHDGLTAVAGKLTRTRLMRVALLPQVSWSTWLARNPEGRLLVGADRSRGIPRE